MWCLAAFLAIEETAFMLDSSCNMLPAADQSPHMKSRGGQSRCSCSSSSARNVFAGQDTDFTPAQLWQLLALS